MSLDLAPGVVIGKRYRLHHELGRGASGTVWEAEHTLLTSRVAIKLLDATRSLTEEQSEILLERFRFEAQISARLSAVTDRIVGVHDAGLFRGAPYLVMELAPGETLQARIDRAPLPPQEVATILEQLAQAVDAAHRAGLAHRDIKPANVLCQVGERAGYKLADFGVAKLFRDTSLGLDSPKKTTENVLVGSPAYMCPEYVSGTPTMNGAGDLWALAVLAYEALTQQIPFDGEAWTQVAVSIVQGRFLPPSQRIPGLGPALDGFFARALALNPEERFSTATELARAFREAADAVEIAPSAEQITQRVESEGNLEVTSSEALPMRRPSRALYWVGAAIVVVGGVLGAWRFLLDGTESAAAPARAATDAPPPAAPTAERSSGPVDAATTRAAPVESETPAERHAPPIVPAKRPPPTDPPPVKKPPRKANPSEVL